jgi:actin related protein 2/3 complex subunit 4
VEGYDLSFLITHAHCEAMLKAKLVDFVIAFMEDVDKEISAVRIAINSRARIVATSWMEAMAGR